MIKGERKGERGEGGREVERGERELERDGKGEREREGKGRERERRSPVHFISQSQCFIEGRV